MSGNSEPPLEGETSMTKIVDSILEDCLYNIVSDTVLKAHREEKQARMQSAAVLAQQTKDNAMRDEEGIAELITTVGATIDRDNRIYLHENPLRTITEILCPTCRLPRLQYPTMGKNSRAPDPAKEYCQKLPYINKEGCDIYGKSLTLEKPSKNKKNNASNSKAKQPDSRSGSDVSRANSPAPGKDSKPAGTAVPSGKCPYCPRYMAFTRIAMHMDRCANQQKRNSRKDALSGKAGQSATPRESSRASTPKPGAGSGTASGAGRPDNTRPGSSQGTVATLNGNKKRKIDLGSDDDGPEPVTPVLKKKKLMKKKSPPVAVKTTENSKDNKKVIDKKDKDKDKDKEGGGEAKESPVKKDKEKASGKSGALKRPPGATPLPATGKIKDGGGAG